MVVMGRVAAPHGVRGLIKVQALSESPVALLDHPQWWLRPRGETSQWRRYRVLSSQAHGSVLLAELEGVASRELAASLRGAEVGVPRSELPEVAADEFYQSDLVGLTVVNREGVMLGRVADFAQSGAHPILRVAAEDGTERLIPWIAQYVDHVDIESGRIGVDWRSDY